MIDFNNIRFKNYPPAMSVPEVARCLQVCTKTIYTMIEHGDITATKIGRQYLISKDLLKEYCKQNKR